MTEQLDKPLPKIVYVTWNYDLDDDGWLETSENQKDLASRDATRVVGVYELKEIRKLSLSVIVEKS